MTLSRRGYTAEQISAKVDLDKAYVYGITHLLAHGEERLVEAVERGVLPLTVAIDISSATDHEVQDALREAYETGGLRGQKLMEVKRILAQRAKNGKGITTQSLHPKRLSAQVVLRMYKQTTAEQRAFRARATRTQEHLLVITSALKQLLADDHLVELLKTEGLDTIPHRLAARIHESKKAS
jgi:ParB family chromosome partitioning protein